MLQRLSFFWGSGLPVCQTIFLFVLGTWIYFPNHIYTLPETNSEFTPENRPGFPKGNENKVIPTIHFQVLCYASFREFRRSFKFGTFQVQRHQLWHQWHQARQHRQLFRSIDNVVWESSGSCWAQSEDTWPSVWNDVFLKNHGSLSKVSKKWVWYGSPFGDMFLIAVVLLGISDVTRWYQQFLCVCFFLLMEGYKMLDFETPGST